MNLEWGTVSGQCGESAERPLVSVFVWTFNDRRFIAKALDSILFQEVGFPVEIIVHDDASTDGTREIITDYEARYPGVFRNILRVENKWSRGGNVMEDLSTAPRGEFIALMHGDDFWTRPDKLRLQVDYLLKNQATAGCFTDWSVVNEAGEEIVPRPRKRVDYLPRYDQAACIFDLKGYYATASLMFRKNVFDCGVPDWHAKAPSDYTLDVVVSARGSIDYLPIESTAYRINDGGVWTTVDPVERELRFIGYVRALMESEELRSRHGARFEVFFRELNAALASRLLRAFAAEEPPASGTCKVLVPWISNKRERWDAVAGAGLLALRRSGGDVDFRRYEESDGESALSHEVVSSCGRLEARTADAVEVLAEALASAYREIQRLAARTRALEAERPRSGDVAGPMRPGRLRRTVAILKAWMNK